MSSPTDSTTRALVAIAKADLPAGAMLTVAVGYREILVVNDGGSYYALLNRCPHHQAPLSAGRVAGTNGPTPVGQFSFSSERRVLRCPWHHYEYDMTTGICPADPKRYRVATYEVQETDEEVIVLQPGPS